MLKPIGDRVLIKPDEAPKQTTSGLHLVEHWKPENSGTVVAVGDYGECITCPDCEHEIRRELQVKVGDVAIFSWQVGQEIFVDDERYLLMKESDISAVLEGETA